MKYFLIENIAVESEVDLTDNGYPNAVEITLQQYDFAIANPTATASEIIAMQLNVNPEPEPEPYIPSLEERLELLEELMLEIV